MSEFVYHAVVDLLPGTDALLPVSALRGIDEAAYRRAISKYDDTPERRRLAQTQIPVIDRGWTEVVFLSPVHPHAIWSAWMKIASAPPRRRCRRRWSSGRFPSSPCPPMP